MQNLGREYHEMVQIEELLEVLEDIQLELMRLHYDDQVKEAISLLYALRVKLIANAARRRVAFEMLHKPTPPPIETPF